MTYLSRFAAIAMVTAIFSHETVKFQTKTCWYRSPVGFHTLTIGRNQQCPLTIEVEAHPS